MTGSPLPQIGDLLDNRYQILGTLPMEGAIVRYRAKDLENHQTVILLALPFAIKPHESNLQFLENELDRLLALRFPGIVRYLNYFRQKVNETTTLYLVQQEIVGSTLGDLIDRGWKPNENTVRQVAVELCKTLAYLHNLNPPLAHQGINPDNILRQENGQFILSGFGIVRETYSHASDPFPTPRPTFYKVPNPLDGQKKLGSDMDNLGLTLLFLLVGKQARELPTHYQKIWCRQNVPLSEPFRDWLEHLIEPSIANRFTLAEEALMALAPSSIEPDWTSSRAPFIPIVIQKTKIGWFMGLSPL
jgi:eukaryotic-like serine/threonine-protein kinase